MPITSPLRLPTVVARSAACKALSQTLVWHPTTSDTSTPTLHPHQWVTASRQKRSRAYSHQQHEVHHSMYRLPKGLLGICSARLVHWSRPSAVYHSGTELFRLPWTWLNCHQQHRISLMYPIALYSTLMTNFFPLPLLLLLLLLMIPTQILVI